MKEKKFEYLSDVLEFVEKKIESGNALDSIKFMGQTLTDMIRDEKAYLLIDNMIAKYPETSDVKSLLKKAKTIWADIPWGSKLKLISVLYFSKDHKQNIFTTFAILAIITEIKHLFNH